MFLFIYPSIFFSISPISERRVSSSNNNKNHFCEAFAYFSNRPRICRDKRQRVCVSSRRAWQSRKKAWADGMRTTAKHRILFGVCSSCVQTNQLQFCVFSKIPWRHLLAQVNVCGGALCMPFVFQRPCKTSMLAYVITRDNTDMFIAGNSIISFPIPLLGRFTSNNPAECDGRVQIQISFTISYRYKHHLVCLFMDENEPRSTSASHLIQR